MVPTMNLDVTTLEESFELVVERAPNLTRRFYEVLFERHPELRPMFGPAGVSRRQEEMLTKALVAVIEHLEDPSWLTTTLRALGAKHVAYGVTEAMYDWVGDALLVTLEEVLADAWTPHVKATWTDAYGLIAGAMIEGARAEAPPSTLPYPAAPHELVPQPVL